MAIIAKSTGTQEFEIVPEGTIQAVVSNVYDIGEHLKRNIREGTEDRQHQVVVMFEMAERMKRGQYAGERFVTSKTYKLSFHEKSNLRKDTEAILSRRFTEEEATHGYDVEQLIGRNCYLAIIHSRRGEKTYSDIQGIISLPTGVQPMVPELPREHCPKWIAEKRALGGVIGATAEQKPATTQSGVQGVQMDPQKKVILDMANAQLEQYVKDGLLTYDEIRWFVKSVAGREARISELDIEQINAVVRKCLVIVEKVTTVKAKNSPLSDELCTDPLVPPSF